MNYSKKMLKVPETEYHSLMGLIRILNKDPLQIEKALLEARIQQNLNNPDINEDLKAKIHQQLFKERRLIAKLIENRPQRVIIDNPQNVPNIAPYLGITSPLAPIKEEENGELNKKILKERIQSTNDTIYSQDHRSTDDEIEEEELSDEGDEYASVEEEVKEITPEKRERKIIQKFDPQQVSKPSKINLTPKKRKELENYISRNIDKFPVTRDGRIVGINGQPVNNSSLKDTLDYFEGKKDASPKGKYFLERNFIANPEVRKIIGLQEGKGRKKRMLIKLKTIKKPGSREKKIYLFKPQLWAKL